MIHSGMELNNIMTKQGSGGTQPYEDRRIMNIPYEYEYEDMIICDQTSISIV
jgi:hypothetical protein